MTQRSDNQWEHATFAGGCFWCTEAIFQRVKGVKSVVSGYTGGTTQHPTYADVCSGNTGHAEAIRIAFDPTEIPYTTLLDIFFHTHDPTQKNRQGNDIGTQYRSAIFYHSDSQNADAKRVLEELNEREFDGKIVTEIEPARTFYPAEDYHKDYFNNNTDKPYCKLVIHPKVTKLLKAYKDVAT